jgi:hypothetical protein
LQINLHGASEDRIFKVNFYGIGCVFTLVRAPGPCSIAEYISKNVFKPAATAAPEKIRALLETLKSLTRTGALTITRIKRRMPELIVLLLFLRI